MRGRFIVNIALLTMAVCATMTAQQTQFRRGIFLHHSVGAHIWGPNESSTSVPAELHSYNVSHSLTDNDSIVLTKELFPWKTTNDWFRWHVLFENNPPGDTDFTKFQDFLNTQPVIMLKSCYHSSEMEGWGTPSDTGHRGMGDPPPKTVVNYKWHWRHIVADMRARPQNFFVIWTNAPCESSYANAWPNSWTYSESFCRWAKDTLAAGRDSVIGAFPPNVYVFDYFHKTATPSGRLRPEFSISIPDSDSHPNAAATELVAPQLVTEVFDAALAYELSLQDPTPPVPQQPTNGASEQPNMVQLDWSSVPNAELYHVQVSTDSLFNGTIVDDSSVVDHSWQIGPLANETTYYWRVRTKKNGIFSAWSPTWHFTTAQYTLTLVTMGGWNLLSVPVDREDYRFRELFPEAVSSAFMYRSSYVRCDTLATGIGYWVRFNSPLVVSLTGDRILTDTLSVAKGWNIVGSIGDTVPVQSIVTVPVNLISSPFFEFDGSYHVVDSLLPGKGYWMKARGPGSLILVASGESDPLMRSETKGRTSTRRERK